MNRLLKNVRLILACASLYRLARPNSDGLMNRRIGKAPL